MFVYNIFILFIIIQVSIIQGQCLEDASNSQDGAENDDLSQGPITLKVAVEEWIPHIKVDKNQNGEIVIKGPMANLLDMLAKAINFKYTLVRPSDGAWGIPNSNGDWNGMIGMVYRNEVDIALGPFGLTYSRTRVVEFSTPILIDYYRILVKRPQAETNPWGFMSPFRQEVWIGILGSVFLVSGTLTLCWKIVGYFYKEDSFSSCQRGSLKTAIPTSFTSYFYSILGTLTTKPCNWSVTSWCGRVVMIIWGISLVVITRSYSSGLTSLLAVRTVNAKYNYLTDLVSDPTMTLVFEKATALVEHMSKVDNGIYKKLADTNKEGRAEFQSSSNLYVAAYQKVRNSPYALLVEDTTCRKVYSDDFTKFGKCDFYIGKEKYWPLIFSIIGQKNQCLMKKMNSIIQRLVSHDLYFKWLENELPNATACLKASTKVTVREAYKMEGLWGVFAVFLAGLLLSAAFFVNELVYKHVF